MLSGPLTRLSAETPNNISADGFLRITALIPRESRNFNVSAAEVPRIYGLPAVLITRMMRLGLPSEHVNGVPHFERSDLVNLSLCLQTGRRYRSIKRFWPRAVGALDGKRWIGYNLSYVTNCPLPEPHTGCRFRVLTPRGRIERKASARHSGPIFTTDIWLSCEWPELPVAARQVVDIAARFEHAWLPRAIQADLAFMRKTGLANCMGMSRILAAEGRKRGLEMRSVFGLLTPPPYAGVHFWPEVKVEGIWVPFDPLMIKQMMAWNVLDREKWSPYRSLGGMQCRLVESRPGPETARRVVTHDRKEVAASFPVCHLGTGGR